MKTRSYFLVLPLLSLVLMSGKCKEEMGTVSGVVTFQGVPCQPGQPDYKVPPCSGPYPGYEISVFRPDLSKAEPVLTTQSDEKGRFSIDLPSGKYVIYTQNGPMPKNKKSWEFEVKGEEVTKRDIRVSTGIQ